MRKASKRSALRANVAESRRRLYRYPSELEYDMEPEPEKAKLAIEKAERIFSFVKMRISELFE